MEDKKISVLMGIYNCEKTLTEALECVVNQTYDNWEVIMCDDGSTDNTKKVAQRYVAEYSDKFILLENDKNMGLNYTLNKCLKFAKGEYIARMDGDDTCSEERFQKEIECLINNPGIDIVSTDMTFFDENGIWGRTHVREKPEKMNFLKGTPFCHAACMVRKKAYLDVGGYSVDKKLLRVEDYHLWIKMYAKGYRGINIQETLYQMRDDRNAQNRRKMKYRFNEAYVKIFAIKQLHLPLYSLIFCIKPLIVGLLPSGIYKKIHRLK